MRVEGDFEVTDRTKDGLILTPVSSLSIQEENGKVGTFTVPDDDSLKGKLHLVLEVKVNSTIVIKDVKGPTDEELLNTAKIEIHHERGGTSAGSVLPKDDDGDVVKRFEELKAIRNEEEVKEDELGLSPSEKLKKRKKKE